MAFRQRNPNIVTPSPDLAPSKKRVGTIEPRGPLIMSTPFSENKENVPPLDAHGSSPLDLDIQGLSEAMAKTFKIYHDDDKDDEEASSIDSTKESSPNQEPPKASKLTLLRPTIQESLPPASPGNLLQYRYDKNWWKSQKESLPPTRQEPSLDVLGVPGTPQRRTLSSLQSRVANKRGLLSPTPIKPPPGLDFAGAVRRGTRETPVRLPTPAPMARKLGTPKPDFADKAMYACREARTKKTPRDAEHAEGLLRKAVSEFHMCKSTKPVDGSIYNNLIHAYAECNLPEKTEAILNLMWQDFKQGNNVRTGQPGAAHFSH